MLGHTVSVTNRLAMVGTLAVALLGSFGCATQTWVIDTVREMDKDIVARLDKIEATAAAEKIRVDQQLTEVRGIATDARGIATDARGIATDARGTAIDARNRADVAQSKADAAQSKADAVDGRVTQALANRLKRTQVQQVDVTFDTGKSDVSQSDRAALQGLLPVLKDNPTYTVDVIGYTDSVGKADENVTLSWRREEAVRRFLAERGVELNRFAFVGVGEELSGDDVKDAEKRAKNRRVTVTIFKPAD